MRRYKCTLNAEKANEVLDFCKKNGHRPSTTSSDLAEKRLGQRCNQITSPAGSCYDPKLAALLIAYPTSKDHHINNQKREIFAFCIVNGHKPGKGSRAGAYERKMAMRMIHYCNPNGSSYDSDFAATVSRFPTYDCRPVLRTATL